MGHGNLEHYTRRACIIMLDAECVFVASWTKSSAWKWVFTDFRLVPDPHTVHYGSGSFSQEFVQNVHGKTCMQITWLSVNPNIWSNVLQKSGKDTCAVSRWRPTWTPKLIWFEPPAMQWTTYDMLDVRCHRRTKSAHKISWRGCSSTNRQIYFALTGSDGMAM